MYVEKKTWMNARNTESAQEFRVSLYWLDQIIQACIVMIWERVITHACPMGLGHKNDTTFMNNFD